MQMDAEQVILSRGLPKTGQVHMYYPADDGVIEAGWWVGRKNEGNKERFITKTVNGDVVVIDLATGLMWAADGTAGGCNNGNTLTWNVALTTTLLLNFAGFNDWRMPNILELLSIVHFAGNNPAIKQPPFANTFSNNYWSSTSRKEEEEKAWCSHMLSGGMLSKDKSVGYYIRYVRGGL